MLKLTSLILLASAVQAAELRRLTDGQQQLFEQQKDQLKQQVVEWRNSAAGQYAQANGFVDAHVDSAEVTDDELQRFFLATQTIENAQKENPQAFFSTDSPFTMMTEEEFARFVGESFNTNQKPFGPSLRRGATIVNKSSAVVMDGSKDWTESGCVAPVKNQGKCGSCWAFAAVTVLESAYCLANDNNLKLFSEQQVNSCDPQSGGCRGGFSSYALSYVKDQQSICTADSYPYVSGTSQQTEDCKPDNCDSVEISFNDIVTPPVSEEGFMGAIDAQPIAVAVAAGNSVWKQYKGGVVSSCPSNRLDHAVTAVGYGTSTSSFYKIQNSWGSTWGDHGFIYLAREGSTCGIMNDDAVYPSFK